MRAGLAAHWVNHIFRAQLTCMHGGSAALRVDRELRRYYNCTLNERGDFVGGYSEGAVIGRVRRVPVCSV